MSKYCVIGKSLPYTLSPEIHAALGNGDYCVRELKEDELAGFVAAGEYAGFNVTIPYKQAIMPLLNAVSREAEAVGAVNTVVVENGLLKGYNTDVDGMRYALLRANIEIAGKNVLILGSGGTSKTARYICENDKAKSVNVVSRTGAINYENCYDLKDTEVIINATPVGTMPHAYETPVDLSRFEALKGVYDCTYNPLETLLIHKARALGLKAANGLAMLVEQARLAHNLYAKYGDLQTLEKSATESVVEKIVRSKENIVLVGMAGSGKSAIGRSVAKMLGRPFFDTDDEIERAVGKKIPQIFAEDGEEFFRRLERDAVERICSLQGIVAATGGGAPLDEKNAFFIKSNGRAYLIKRDASLLATEGRPLSSDLKKAEELYEKRKPAYLAIADETVENDGTVQEAAKKIIDAFNAKTGFYRQ